MRSIAATACFLFLSVALAACAGPAADKPLAVNIKSLPAGASSAAQADSPLSRAVLKSVNAFRAGKGIGTLSADATLQRAAAVHAADMAMRDYFGHHNPEGQGPRERVLAVNPEFKGRVAENLQMVEGPSYAAMSDDALAKVLTDKWAQSPMHRKNMQLPDMTQSGVGIARSGEKIIAVQVFSGP
ncbi:SCP-like extracellular [Parvibaculum lavamentivorans DS-1]|uniref:SCP-like extracellular n=1 Tax=Parvibaculum lavamentivorans (strain DS-1 / DSM 13023 / NCIMB 13966) TaxID=402881 RepID=A7HQA0_PARL1|nr:CAP domain-containing protein [Parvibaculum lavamentivorans]ABS62083.1 SCP-like extracellular [Parvibaculum lavamentivorans DS-1]